MKQMRIAKYIAHAFSVILHPVFMTVYGVCLLFIYSGPFFNSDIFFRIMVPIAILTCIFPINGIFLLKHFGVVKDYALTDKKDRIFPFIIIFCCYAFLIYYFAQPNIPLWFFTTLTMPLALLLTAGIITSFWKISAHMMSMGGLIGAAFVISYYIFGVNPYALFIVMFILAGCLGSSRLILKRHTPAQVYAGFMAGLIISIVYILYVPYFFTFRF